jgi:hypothetical protein
VSQSALTTTTDIESHISTVIQARDKKTLEPLGYYFLLFSSEAAARQYLDRTVHLHTLAKSHTANSGKAFPDPLPRHLMAPGEDPKTVLRGFSLLPGHAGLSIRMMKRPFRPEIREMLLRGGAAAIATKRDNVDNMVLFSIDMGDISPTTIRHVLREDGKRRNLLWKLADGDNIIKLKVDGEPDTGRDERPLEGRAYHTVKLRPLDFARKPPRFAIAFQDSNEARRFVREWHRRPLILSGSDRMDDEPPPTVNVEILW